LAKPFVLLLEILQLPKLVTAHAAILLAPPVERQFGNADLANGNRHRHALAAQNLNLPKLRDDLDGPVPLACHCGPPSWSKPYFKVDPFNGGGSEALIENSEKMLSSATVAGLASHFSMIMDKLTDELKRARKAFYAGIVFLTISASPLLAFVLMPL